MVDFSTCFTHEKTPQTNFCHQDIIVENNYVGISQPALSKNQTLDAGYRKNEFL